MKGLLGHPLYHLCLHLDCGQVNRVVCGLDDGTKHFDTLLWADGSSQHRGSFLSRPHHLKQRQQLGSNV